MTHTKYRAKTSATASHITNTDYVVTASATASATSSTSQENATSLATAAATAAAQTDAATTASIINIAQYRTFYVSRLTDDDAIGSLRHAIHKANEFPNATIAFTISGIFTLSTPLPELISPTNILGNTAPNYNPNDPPVIVIDFQTIHTGFVLTIGASGSVIRDITWKHAASPSANLTLIATNSCRIFNCHLLNAANGPGLLLAAGASRNIIGHYRVSTTGTRLPSNVVSGNNGPGISLDFASYNYLYGNYIGPLANGTTAYPNTGTGLALTNSSNHNIVGAPIYTDIQGNSNNPTGTKGAIPPTFVIPPWGNLISGNLSHGILIGSSSNNTFYGNFVGTTANGNSALPNHGNGLFLSNATNIQLLGCNLDNNPFVFYNIFSGNAGNGIAIEYSSNITIQGNFVGIGANNAVVVPNTLDGIYVGTLASNITIGGVIPLGNVAAGNGLNGMRFTSTSTQCITFNTFAGLFAFGGAAPNGGSGLLIDGFSSNHTIGDATNEGRTNVFSGNSKHGIEFRNYANNCLIEALIVGTNTNGTAALPNGENGILIANNCNNIIIGRDTDSVILNSVISGNTSNGIEIADDSFLISIVRCNIGTDVGETRRIPNGGSGVLFSGRTHNCLVGGTLTSGNVIVNNDMYGVELDETVEHNTIIYNYLGVTRNTQFPMPNQLGNFNSGFSSTNITEPNTE